MAEKGEHVEDDEHGGEMLLAIPIIAAGAGLVEAAAAAIAPAAPVVSTVGGALCADGACGNEVQAAGQVVQKFAGAAKYVFDAKAAQYRDVQTGRFVSPRNIPWPGNRGFAGNPTEMTLSEGTLIDRFGRLTGQYAGTLGATVSERGMAMGSNGMQYTMLEVVKSFTVLGGPAAAVPEFGAVGGAMQYFLKGGIQWWINQGYLRIVP